MRVAVLGEILWDIVGDSRYLGGAPLNFALHLQGLGHEALLISALGDDLLGAAAIKEIEARGLSTRFIRLDNHPTGTVTVHMDERGAPDYVIHRPAAYDFPALSAEREHELLTPSPSWIYFGTLQQMSSKAFDLTMTIRENLPYARTFYDLNLRQDSYNTELLSTLLRQADVVKLNEPEAAVLANFLQFPSAGLQELCRALAHMFTLQAVCVTRGALGCCLLIGDTFVEAPGYCVTVADTIGAGDAFAAAFLHGMTEGWPPLHVADFANRLGAVVASLPGGAPAWQPEQLDRLAHRQDAP
jgi:fructokinase